MAETVSTILDYLRQHHFPQAEAALKAELAGRDGGDGLLGLDVNDIGVRSVHEADRKPEPNQKAELEQRQEQLFDLKVTSGGRVPSPALTATSDNGPWFSKSEMAALLHEPSVVEEQLQVLEKTASRRSVINQNEVEPAAAPLNNVKAGSGSVNTDSGSGKAVSGSVNKGSALGNSAKVVSGSDDTKVKVGSGSEAKVSHEVKLGAHAGSASSNKPSSGTSAPEHLKKDFWEKKDELLWVPPNRQSPQLGKVHPLDEGQLSSGVPLAGTDVKEPSTDSVAFLKKKPSTPESNAENSKNGLLHKYLPRREEAEVRHEIKHEDLFLQQQLTVLKIQEDATTSSDKASSSVHEDNEETSVYHGKEGLPRLPPVRLKSVEIFPEEWMTKLNHDAEVEHGLTEAYGLGSYLDVPVGQDISSSGTKRSAGSNRLSVSQGIVEDPAEILSTFATVADDYPEEYWDSDDYEDDDDPGYTRQLIEDETGFLASEINYPTEEERARVVERNGQAGFGKYDDDERSFEESYFSGEEYYKSRAPRDAKAQAGNSGQHDHQGKEYDGHLLDSEELKQIRSEPAWQGFVVQGNAIGKTHLETTSEIPDLDPDEFSREIRETYLAESSGEGEVQDCNFRGVQNCFEVAQFNRPSSGGGFQELNSAEDEQDIVLQYYGRPWVAAAAAAAANGAELPVDRNGDEGLANFQFGGFSFPSPSSTGDIDGSRAESGRSLWSGRGISSRGEEPEHFVNGFVGPDDTLASWKRKSNDSSPIVSPGEDNDLRLALSTRSTVSPRSSDGDCCLSVGERVDEEAEAQREETEAVAAYDEEAIAVHEHFQRLQAEEEEFETFDLKIIHRKNRTGFEEEKDFQVVINSVIAGRYHVTEYLGSAAFSKAIQAHDLHTGMDVCMKIIKNNKDFFDQSLDEIKLLKYINKHDPADKYHILRLYDYFYHREHLFIVCELLRANLYEFHKYNRDSGGEVYFTMPRLQSIARQCLEALEFLHNLGLIHCDLKPENILVKSYSRCEVKVIDLGSSCFQSDHLCSYVQSRSYRAPEVILGLPYDQKIDMWSLGCILAELCSGNVLFQNDSLATLLARVVGIIGPLDPEMVAKGRESYKFLTKNNRLYDRNQETNRMDYLVPKKTTLAHRLPIGDQGFIDFVRYLLQINPKNRPSASEALKHPWLSFPYEPISS